MVRLALLIVSLLGMFLLNACSGSSHNPSNIDTADAVSFQKGQFSGKPLDIKYTKIDERGKKVEVAQELVFNPEATEVHVDWENRKVAITTEYMPEYSKDKSLKAGSFTVEGTFNDENVVLIKSEDPQLYKSNALFSVNCADNLCKNLNIGLASDINENGEVVFKQQTMLLPNPNPTKITTPNVPKTEVQTDEAGLRNSADKNKTTQTAKEKKAAEAKAAEDKKIAEEKEKAEAAQDPAEEIYEDSESTYEPGVPTLQPSLITPGMRNTPAGVPLTLKDYSDTGVFPFDMGDKYAGKSLGFYSFCTAEDRKKGCTDGLLAKGVDVTFDGIGSLVKRLGFNSGNRGFKRYYGSGLLVKNIEEVGKTYSEKYPGESFMTNDLAQKAGGPIYSVDKKGRIRKNKNGKKIMAHQSHQNGLDVDISIPRKGTVVYNYEKAWTIVKSFVKLGYVDVIFLNPVRIREMCAYLKKSGEIKEKDTSKIFGHLYREGGHKSHMHVRLKCTNHNRGCWQAGYTTADYGVCKP